MKTAASRINNNQVVISGEIVSNLKLDHDVCGEGFYKSELMVLRKSGEMDFVPITISERLIDVNSDWAGRYVRISGQFRSYNNHENGRNRLVLSVFAREFEEIELSEHGENENSILLDGHICKRPIYRETPFGREISDIMLAINRPYGKSDYIPCIAWGRNARFAGGLEIGTRLKVYGRIQSRVYTKKLPDGRVEDRVAYEVSVSKMEVL